MTKVLGNRLKYVMPFIVSQKQKAFIKGRFIVENAMIGIDILYYIHMRSSNGIALDLDIVKAFDRIEWPFLRYILHKLKFLVAFIQLIKSCVTSTHIVIR